MFPNWTVKCVCEFFLKRFLGRFIQGVVNLDGLQVKLGVGNFKLNDIALNTDFLNKYLGVTPVIAKEGFIGSISLKIPWKLDLAAFENCEINVEDLVLSLVPRIGTDVETSTEECSASEVYTEQVEGATYLNGVQDWVKKTVAQMLERFLLGLHVKIKNLIIVFEQGSEICGANLGDESNCQSQSILALRVLETEYGNAEESASGILAENATLTKFINFQGVTVDIYDRVDKVSQLGNSKPFIASFLSGQTGKTSIPIPMPLVHGNGGGFSGSVQLSIYGTNGSMDVPKINAEIHFDPFKLQLQPYTIHRLISLLYSIHESGDKGSEALLCSNNEQSIGFEHDGSGISLHLSESVTTDVKISSFLNMPSQVRKETTLIPDSMIISNWVQNADSNMPSQVRKETTLITDSMIISNWVQIADSVESEDEFFDCLDDSTNLSASLDDCGSSNLPASLDNCGLSNLPFSVFGFIAAGCNLNVKLDGISVVLAFEDHGHANVVSSLERSGIQCLEQETGCVEEEESYLEANFEDLVFSVQVSAKEVRFKTMVKQFEIYEYLLEDSRKGTRLSFSNCGECPSIRHLQRAVEDALPCFPLSLYAPVAVDKINNMINEDVALPHAAMANRRLEKKQSTSGIFKKFVKIKLLASNCDSAHHFSLNCHFGDLKCYDFASSCIKFELQLQPFVLWVDFYAANKLCQLIESIANSDEARYCCSSNGRNEAPQRSIQGNFSMSCARVILCFPKEINKDMSPYFMRDNFICIDFSESASAGKMQQEGLLKEDVVSSKDCHFPSSSFVYLKMGESTLFLVSPSSRTIVKRISGDLGEPHFSARKAFSILTREKGAYLVIGIQWQDIPGIGMRIVERAWEKGNEHWKRTGSRGVNGSNSEFTAAKALEFTGSYVREEMIQNSALVIRFLLPHVQIDLYGSEHILVANLLSLLTDCICFKGHKGTCLNSEGKLVKEACRSKVSQSSILFECKVLDIAIHVAEPVNIKASMERELRGSWASFRLTVRNVDVLCVSNLGGVPGARYFCLNHDEGFLYGSLSDKREQPQSDGAIREFCLLCLKTNVLGRGDGEGTHALARGNAGTTIIHVDNPKYLHSLTTVTIRCATLVAPGGRLDWLGSIISFFNQSSNEKQFAGTPPQPRLFKDANSRSTSFSLELLDIAVSYEPFPEAIRASSFDSAGSCVEEAHAPVACILAAAAIRFSFKEKPEIVNKKYTILLEDVGLMVLDSSKGRNHKHAYDAESLQSKGYVKIAGEAIMNLDVEMNCQDKLLWEVNCTKCHICLGTCHDTTAALSHLVSQLQLLFVPDYEEFAVHLQTRLNSRKQVSSIQVDETFEIYSKDHSNSHRVSEAISVGWMDDIVDNAFCSEDLQARLENEEGIDTTLNGQSQFLFSELVFEEGCDLEGNVSTSFCIVDHIVKERVPSKSTSNVQADDMKDFLESFLVSQILESKQLKVGESASPSKSTMAIDEDIWDGKGGWYEGSSVRVLENHISNIEHGKVNGCHGSSGNISSSGKVIHPVGRISLKNFRVTWKMYAGSDWPSHKTQDESARNESSLFEVELHGVNVRYDAFPEGGGPYASKLSLSIQDLGILDHSEHAPWKKILVDYNSRKHPRDLFEKALELEIEAVKPDPSIPLEEYRVIVKLLPVQLHLDQIQLEFFMKFFAQKGSSRELSEKEELFLPFFQKCEINPVSIHVNYVPRRVDVNAIREGIYYELLNIFSWKGIHLHLKGVQTGGVSGVGSVSEIVIRKWVEDICQNHLHKLLKGVAPIRPLVALAKLFSDTVKHYRKDRRLLKSLVKEAIASLSK